MRVLNVIEVAYRATIEEQDDTVLWLTHAMKGGGADIHVLLRGNAVNYAVKAQDASGLSFGDRKQTRPPEVAADVEKLLARGVHVFVVEDDVAERGLERTDLVAGLEPITRSGVPKLFAGFDQIWHW